MMLHFRVAMLHQPKCMYLQMHRTTMRVLSTKPQQTLYNVPNPLYQGRPIYKTLKTNNKTLNIPLNSLQNYLFQFLTLLLYFSQQWSIVMLFCGCSHTKQLFGKNWLFKAEGIAGQWVGNIIPPNLNAIYWFQQGVQDVVCFQVVKKMTRLVVLGCEQFQTIVHKLIKLTIQWKLHLALAVRFFQQG